MTEISFAYGWLLVSMYVGVLLTLGFQALLRWIEA